MGTKVGAVPEGEGGRVVISRDGDLGSEPKRRGPGRLWSEENEGDTMTSKIRTVLVSVCLTALGCSASMQDDLVRDVVIERARSVSDFGDAPGLQVLICGSAGPVAAPGRASNCVAVAAGGKIYVVDVGAGSAASLGRLRVRMPKVAGVLLTHFHSDHITELGELNLQSWAQGRSAPLPVYGPTGVTKVVDGFNLAYEQSRGYRVAHHGADFLEPGVGRLAARPFAIPAETPGASTIVFEDGGLTVRAFSVSHAPVSPAVGYRFDYEGRSVFITGDTAKSKNVIDAAKDTDVLVHDAMAHHIIHTMEQVSGELGLTRQQHIAHDIPDYHASVVEAAEVANEANARLLVLYHLVPPPVNFLTESVFLRGVDDVRDHDVILSSDGLLIDLPPRSTEIRESMLGD